MQGAQLSALIDRWERVGEAGSRGKEYADTYTDSNFCTAETNTIL